MSEMYFYFSLFAAAILVFVAVVLFITNKINKKDKGKDNLVKVILGWSFVATAIIGIIVAFLLYVNESTGTFGILMILILCPLFVVAGFIAMLSCGIANLIEGNRKDENGQKNKALVVKGSFLTGMALAIVATIIVTFAILFATGSSISIGAM